MEILTILGSGVAAAAVTVIGQIILKRIDRKNVTEDREYEKSQNCETKLDAVAEGVKYMLYDRILYLGKGHIKDGEVTFDNRRILNAMHKVYHSGLGGNGDLDSVMNEVNELPLKILQ